MATKTKLTATQASLLAALVEARLDAERTYPLRNAQAVGGLTDAERLHSEGRLVGTTLYQVALKHRYSWRAHPVTTFQALARMGLVECHGGYWRATDEALGLRGGAK